MKVVTFCTTLIFIFVPAFALANHPIDPATIERPPPRPQPYKPPLERLSGFTYEGKFYHCYAEFRGTRAWLRMKVKGELRHEFRDAGIRIKKRRREAAIEFMIKRRRKGDTAWISDERARWRGIAKRSSPWLFPD